MKQLSSFFLFLSILEEIYHFQKCLCGPPPTPHPALHGAHPLPLSRARPQEVDGSLRASDAVPEGLRPLPVQDPSRSRSRPWTPEVRVLNAPPPGRLVPNRPLTCWIWGENSTRSANLPLLLVLSVGFPPHPPPPFSFSLLPLSQQPGVQRGRWGEGGETHP